MKEETEALFVYGTLLSALPNHALVAPFVTAVEAATSEGRLYALPAGYPALVPDPSGRVRGELFWLRESDECLRRLDAYEDFDARDPERSLYIRERWVVRGDGGSRRGAWCYVWNPRRVAALRRDAVEVPNGDWRAYAAGR